MITKKLFYESPSAETVYIHPEGMICDSDTWNDSGKGTDDVTWDSGFDNTFGV